MADKEAKARVKINKLLEEAGWRFTDVDQDNVIKRPEASFNLSHLVGCIGNSKKDELIIYS